MRGLCMLLVVLGHSIGGLDRDINPFILSFHMPAFFFISGICFAPRDVPTAILRKCKSLIYPYLTLSVVGIAVFLVLRPFNRSWIDITFLQSVVGVFWGDEIYGFRVTPGFWFVYALISVVFLYILTHRLSFFVKLGVSLGVWAALHYFAGTFYMQKAVMNAIGGYFFYTCGHLVASCALPHLCAMSKPRLYAALTVLFAAVVALAYTNTPVFMGNCDYGNFALFVPCAVLGSIMLLLISTTLRQNKFVEYVGRHSLLYLPFHFYVLFITQNLARRFLEIQIDHFPWYILRFALTVAVTTAVVWCIDTRAKWLVHYPKA